MTTIDSQLKKAKTSKFIQYLYKLEAEKVSGTVHVQAIIGNQKIRQGIFIIKAGQLIYGGLHEPISIDMVYQLGKKFKPSIISVALAVAKQKVRNKHSARELLAMLVKMRILTWEQAESTLEKQAVVTLEQFYNYPCWVSLESQTSIDLSFDYDCHGLNITNVINKIGHRKQQWSLLKNSITSMDIVPVLPHNVETIVTNLAVLQHLQEWVDGQKSIVDIANSLQKDTLEIASTYYDWASKGWVKFVHVPSDSRKRISLYQPSRLTSIAN